jgi:hypothetical protein
LPSLEIPQLAEKPVQYLEGFGSLDFQSAATDGIFIPKIFDHLNEPPLLGIEVAVEFLFREIVELFQD